jgi:isopentenyl diphosphate isomerase/L-lactate dehydrogenase-like FMN-dependent dehydrogenase
VVAPTPEGPGDGTDAVSLADYVNHQFDPTLSWTDLDWMGTIWDGPIVVNAIQTVADVLAVEAGVEAIALSNHGDRQLDTAPAPIDLVEPVVQAVGDRAAVLCDGGVRRGSDIVKAVALGATACMAGRAYFYGLGAGGERGGSTRRWPCSTPTSAARWPWSAPAPSPTSPVTSSTEGASPRRTSRRPGGGAWSRRAPAR